MQQVGCSLGVFFVDEDCDPTVVEHVMRKHARCVRDVDEGVDVVARENGQRKFRPTNIDVTACDHDLPVVLGAHLACAGVVKNLNPVGMGSSA